MGKTTHCVRRQKHMKLTYIDTFSLQINVQLSQAAEILCINQIHYLYANVTNIPHYG